MSTIPIQAFINSEDVPTVSGDNGLSAYELAIANGFTGTVSEWLASLKGEPGQDGADGSGSLKGVVSLTTFMDERYGVGSWSKRTGVGQGTDIGPALADALDYIRAEFGRGNVYIPPGLWLMNTAPTAAQYSGNVIFGAGSMSSVVIYNNNEGVSFNFSGANGYTGGGVKGLGLLLEDGYPTSYATQILQQGDSTYQPDQMEFSDLYMSAIGTSYWYEGFKSYGNSRTSPQGIRICDISNMQIFRCRNTGVYLSNVVQFTGKNIGIYAGQGTGGNFYLSGGGASSTNSTQAYFEGVVCNDLNITNCTKFKFSGTASTVSTSSANYGDVCIPGATKVGTFGANVRFYS